MKKIIYKSWFDGLVKINKVEDNKLERFIENNKIVYIIGIADL